MADQLYFPGCAHPGGANLLFGILFAKKLDKNGRREDVRPSHPLDQPMLCTHGIKLQTPKTKTETAQTGFNVRRYVFHSQ